jgi:hypothetical protein
MKKDPFESLNRAERLLAQQFGDAPRELQTTIDLAMNALKHGNFGDALNLINRAHDLVKEKGLTEWEAEVAAVWAVYYFHTGDEKQMYKAISFAQRQEPDNKRIEALRKALEKR